MRTGTGARRGRLVEWIRQVWYPTRPTLMQRVLRSVLRGPAALFGLIVSVRNQSYDTGLRGVKRVGIPLISVGNLSVGGTGKTPVTRWIAARLLERGERPAILSRGYGEDELALHRRWHPQVPVHANPDRVRAAQAALGSGATCGVLDDGFQHRRLARDVDVVLLAAEDPLPPILLPAGPFREPLRSLKRASAVLITSRGGNQEEAVLEWMAQVRRLPQHPPVVHLPMQALGWSGLEGEAVDAPPSSTPLHAILSIGRPEGFGPLVETLLPGAATSLTLHTFVDHHEYTESDILEVLRAMEGQGHLLTTEKDAVKLVTFADLFERHRVRVRVLRMGVHVDARAARILDRILDRVLALGQGVEEEG